MTKTCSIVSCVGIVIAKGLCTKHYQKFRKYGDPAAGYENQAKRGEGSRKEGRYHRVRVNGKEKHAHILIAEKAIGKQLPKGARVHHVDGDRLNNKNENLVICPSDAYHMLLHARQKAFDETGNVNSRSCNICHKYDDLKNLLVCRTATNVRTHSHCLKAYQQQLRKKHVVTAEKAIGRKLKNKEKVYRVNGIKSDNRPKNLVICPDRGYLILLQTRQKALNKTGNANFKSCRYCKEYDDPNMMFARKHGGFYHRICMNLYKQQARRNKCQSAN